MTPQFKQLLQIGIIVRDVDRAVRYYEDVLGMGPWEVSFMRGDEPPMEDLVVDGRPMPCIVSKLAFLKAYGVELELIEPIADTPFKRGTALAFYRLMAALAGRKARACRRYGKAL